MEIISRSLAETAVAAEKILARLARRRRNKNKSAVVVGLAGELGSGKTTFVQLAARQLGLRAPVQSPTFVIMKSYAISEKWQGLPLLWRRLVHIDCYRLDKADDLLRLGWDELIIDPANLILVEWPERVGDLLSSPTLKIKFEVAGESERKIIYD